MVDCVDYVNRVILAWETMEKRLGTGPHFPPSKELLSEILQSSIKACEMHNLAIAITDFSQTVRDCLLKEAQNDTTSKSS